MKLIQAQNNHLDTVAKLVYTTIVSVYPKYYPEVCVKYFLDYHARERIEQDIKAGNVYLLFEEGNFVGTGTVNGDHICRVFVLPKYQQKGYGATIMKELERLGAEKYESLRLDASLPAYGIYRKLGYHTVEYHEIPLNDKAVLCYHEMEKKL